MINDSFKMRYNAFPIAVSCRNWDSPVTERTTTFCHNHKEFEIVQILKGKATLCVGNETYTVVEGDTYFISPYDVHYTVVEKGDVLVNQCICFDSVFLWDNVFADELENGTLKIRTLIQKNEIIRAHIKSIYEACSKEEEVSSMEAAGHIYLLFAYLRKNGFVETSLAKEAVFCKKVLSFLSENFQKNISSADAAKALYTSQGHFCRRFRQNFEESFSLYLRRYRLEHAKEKLADGTLSVLDVAMQSGFTDASYFAKSFRETFGISPGAYRKNKL